MSGAIPNVLSLNQWNGIVPVILPVGPQTISCIGTASAGVAVPFFLFLVAMYYILIPIWMSNFHSDKNASSLMHMMNLNGDSIMHPRYAASDSIVMMTPNPVYNPGLGDQEMSLSCSNGSNACVMSASVGGSRRWW